MHTLHVCDEDCGKILIFIIHMPGKYLASVFVNKKECAGWCAQTNSRAIDNGCAIFNVVTADGKECLVAPLAAASHAFSTTRHNNVPIVVRSQRNGVADRNVTLWR